MEKYEYLYDVLQCTVAGLYSSQIVDEVWKKYACPAQHSKTTHGV
jgi:hypothetical protein